MIYYSRDGFLRSARLFVDGLPALYDVVRGWIDLERPRRVRGLVCMGVVCGGSMLRHWGDLDNDSRYLGLV